MSGKLVMIDWIDAYGSSSWRDKKEILEHKAPLCRTIGFFLGSDGDSIKLAATFTNESEYKEIASIPKGCVVRKQTLEITLPKLKRRDTKHKS